MSEVYPEGARNILQRIEVAEDHGKRWTGVTGDDRRAAVMALAQLGLVIAIEGAGLDRGVLLVRRAQGAVWRL